MQITFFVFATFLPIVLCDSDLSSYQFSIELVQDTYWLYWNFNSETEVINFAVKVLTTGWIGFGISPNGQMRNSDVVIGWIDDSSSKSYFHDRFAFGRYTPPIDPIQNWFLSNAEQNNGYTTLEFYRNFITCDERDNKLLLETQRIIYSWNDNTPTVTQNGDGTETYSIYRHTYQGSTSINLLSGLPDPPDMPNDAQTFTIAVNEVNVPNSQTTYWCTGMELDSSITESENYIIRVSPYITSGNEPYVHHMLVYLCDGLQDSDLDVGGNCDSDVSSRIQYCLSQLLISAWAVGGSDFIYPEHVAYPIGGSNNPQYAVIQIHYNNLNEVSDIVDSSGFIFKYTNTPRQYDAGILFFGHAIAPSMVIPPNAHNFTTIGLCTNGCTQTHFPSSGIHIFANMLHTHLAGSGLVFSHVNKTQCSGISRYQELKPIEANLHYDFNFQQATHLPHEITILPGDILLLKCFYNTTGRNGVTLGGESTLQEMCLSFPVYYPRLSLAKCISLPLFDNIDVFIDEHVPSEHKSAFYSLTPGSSPDTIESTMNLLDWTQDQIDGYQQSVYINGLQWSYCGNQGYSDTTPSLSCCSYEDPDVCTGYKPAPCCERSCVSSTNSMYCIGVDLITILLLLCIVVV